MKAAAAAAAEAQAMAAKGWLATKAALGLEAHVAMGWAAAPGWGRETPEAGWTAATGLAAHPTLLELEKVTVMGTSWEVPLVPLVAAAAARPGLARCRLRCRRAAAHFHQAHHHQLLLLLSRL